MKNIQLPKTHYTKLERLNQWLEKHDETILWIGMAAIVAVLFLTYE